MTSSWQQYMTDEIVNALVTFPWSIVLSVWSVLPKIYSVEMCYVEMTWLKYGQSSSICGFTLIQSQNQTRCGTWYHHPRRQRCAWRNTYSVHVALAVLSCEFKYPVARTGTSSYTPQTFWDVIICPCPWYLLLIQHSSNMIYFLYLPLSLFIKCRVILMVL